MKRKNLINLKLWEVGKEFERKLNDWAKKAVDYCHSGATDTDEKKRIDRAFYAFQSAPKFNPKVLILGLNPGDSYSYADQYDNQRLGLKDKKMTSEVFIQQNQWYFGGRYFDPSAKWNILNKFKKTKSYSPELEAFFEDMVYMNMLYFNSKNFSEFKKLSTNWREVFDKCIELTKEAIEIIQPDYIVCLGIDNCFNALKGSSKSDVIESKILVKSEVKIGYKPVAIYGTFHPSARKSDAQRKKAGELLHNELFK